MAILPNVVLLAIWEVAVAGAATRQSILARICFYIGSKESCIEALMKIGGTAIIVSMAPTSMVFKTDAM